MVQINQVQTKANLKETNSSLIKTPARDLVYVHWFSAMLQAF